MHVAHLLAPRLDGEDHTKDIDFTPIDSEHEAPHG
jgi:NTE family protein